MDESIYDRAAVAPMARELNDVKVRSLATPAEVDAVLTRSHGTVLVVVNSVCGCAAGAARPGVMRALQNKLIPDEMVTVFAGVDRSATDRARTYMKGVAPSSPCVALFKDGKLAHTLERRHIERMTDVDLASNLAAAFDQHCQHPGPSVPPEVYEKLRPQRACGSSIPLSR